MAITMQEQLVSLRDVPNYLPPDIDGKKVDESSIYRWCRVGVQGKKLEFLRFGRKLFTSVEALERFGSPEPTEEEQEAALQAEADTKFMADEAELEAMGA